MSHINPSRSTAEGMVAVDKSGSFKALVGGRFVLDSGPLLGAVDSKHKVFSGRYEGQRVVVKPHDSERRGRHEQRMLDAIRQSGIVAVRPLVLIPDQMGGVYLLMHYERLVSAGRLPLANMQADTEDSVAAVAGTLAALHGRGFSHGDAQIKNFGLRQNGSVRAGDNPVVVYDPERGGTDEWGHFWDDPYGHDLSSLTESLAYKGFGDPDLDLAAHGLERLVIDPYTAGARRLGFGENEIANITHGAYGAFLDAHQRTHQGRYLQSA